MACGGSRIARQMRNDVLEYLIIIDDEDELQRKNYYCDSTYRKKLEDTERALRGELYIYTIDDVNNMNIIIKGILETNKLYVKLPKEKIFVSSKIFDSEYMKSQLTELIYIFRKTKATTLKIKQKQSNDSIRDLSLGAGVDISDITIGIDISRSSDNKNETSFTSELEFEIQDDSSYVNDLIELYDDPKIHYLKRFYDWQNFVEERLDGKSKKITFRFCNQSILSNKTKASIELSKLNINCEFSKLNSSLNTITFEAIYD